MEPTTVVLPFRRPDDSLARRGIALFSPAAETSRTTNLRGLYRAAMGETDLESDPPGRLDQVFGCRLGARAVAMNARLALPPLGLALAVPVAGLQELAEALASNHFDRHVADTLSRRRSWALLASVSEANRRIGIGRALANHVLDAIRGRGGERVFLAARSLDAWTHPWLLERGWGRDGVTRETHPRVVYSRDVNFVF